MNKCNESPIDHLCLYSVCPKQVEELVRRRWLHKNFRYVTLFALVLQFHGRLIGCQQHDVWHLTIILFANVRNVLTGDKSVHDWHIAVHEYELEWFLQWLLCLLLGLFFFFLLINGGLFLVFEVHDAGEDDAARLSSRGLISSFKCTIFP